MRMVAAGMAVSLSAVVSQGSLAQVQSAPDRDAPSIAITVPLVVQDLTDRANGLIVACALSTAADEVVASGRTYILPTEYTQWDEQFLQNQVITTDWAETLAGGLESSEPIGVELVQNQGYQIEGWVHGRCDLLIMTIDPQAQTSAAQAPVECGLSPPNDQLHLCAFPGSDFVSSVEFLRPGFRRDGTLETLPGVD